MNFTSEYTKFASRYYHAEDVSATYRKAEELAASRVLRIIYTKHKDLWQKFKEIKASKNIKPNWAFLIVLCFCNKIIYYINIFDIFHHNYYGWALHIKWKGKESLGIGFRKFE